MTISLQVLALPEGEVLPQRECHVTATPFTLGRDYDCDLVLPDAKAQLSRHHLRFLRSKAGRYAAVDLSTNGTKLNGTAMKNGSETALSDGDILNLNGYEILLGILQDPVSDVLATPSQSPKPHFQHIQASDIAPLHPDAPHETFSASEPAGFSGEVSDLDEDLLFDPFAEGPEINEERQNTMPAPEAEPVKEVQAPSFRSVRLEQETTVAQQPLTHWAPQSDRPCDKTMRAVESAMVRFLETLDPARAEMIYRELTGFLGPGKARYWSVYKREFNGRVESGEYVRSFKALLAEELSK